MYVLGAEFVPSLKNEETVLKYVDQQFGPNADTTEYVRPEAFLVEE